MMIKTEKLQKIFRTEDVETWALSDVSIEIAAGEFVAIMGPSGCGKSTFVFENMELLTALNKEGTTVVMVTHSQHDARYAGRIINLFDGKLVSEVRL